MYVRLTLNRIHLLRLVLCAVVIAAASHARGQAASNNSAPLRLGTAWYPEQWPEDRWEKDLQLMQDAHMTVVRVGEFAWSTMEPSEGKFEFEWLDRAIALAAKHHIAIVLGTPTAAPPAWLTSKYPDTLRVDEDGKRAEHGNRQQFSFASPRYREFAAGIAGKMAERYGRNPNVLGWQIDNELAAPSFDDESKREFHEWLHHRYGTIAELNRRWTTAYWSQTYDNFDEIPVHARNENPALLLDWKRFVTDTWVSYLENQIHAIRAHAAQSQWITTNTMHWFTGFDHYTVHRVLDMAAWDDYFPDGHLDPNLNAAEHDLVRGYKRKNFWLMETQPGHVNWGAVNASLPPGVTREMAWQAVGHGADAVLYWQWRSALNGQEQYHGSLLGPDGTPVPIYAEIQQIGAEFERVNQALAHSGFGSLTDASTHARVAILNSYDSNWAIDFQRHTNKFDYVNQVTDFYRAVEPLAQSIDIVSADADLKQYAVVFAPALNVLPDATAKHLDEYVRQGGNLVLGPRSGMKDVDNGLQPERQPGPLTKALGGHVVQYYALDAPVPITGSLGTGSAGVWAETLAATDPATKILMTYGASDGPSWFAGKPAALTHDWGKGRITYVGATLDPGLMQKLAAWVLDTASVKAILPGLPAGVELMERSNRKGDRVWILINHGNVSQAIDIGSGNRDLLTGEAADHLTLAAHGVAVMEQGGR
jgi:beta-galactosidase